MLSAAKKPCGGTIRGFVWRTEGSVRRYWQCAHHPRRSYESDGDAMAYRHDEHHVFAAYEDRQDALREAPRVLHQSDDGLQDQGGVASLSDACSSSLVHRKYIAPFSNPCAWPALLFTRRGEPVFKHTFNSSCVIHCCLVGKVLPF